MIEISRVFLMVALALAVGTKLGIGMTQPPVVWDASCTTKVAR